MRNGTFADGWVNMSRFWKALFAINPSFSVSGSSLAPLINLISAGNPGGGAAFQRLQLQNELDKLDPRKAAKYQNALRILIDDYADVCYTGATVFTPRAVQRPTNAQVVQPNQNAAWGIWNNGASSGYVQWDSAKFELEVKVFQIVPSTAPANRWEIGFVQHCTSKNNNSSYDNGDLMNQHPTTAAPWCDAADPNDTPWYDKGIHNGKTAYAVLAHGIQRDVTYGMDDSFDQRKHPYRPVRPGGAVQNNSKITGIRCDQAFSTWICRRDTITHDWRLLKKTTYSIIGQLRISAVGQISVASSNVSINTAETPPLNTQLPHTTVASMNNNEHWFCNNLQV